MKVIENLCFVSKLQKRTNFSASMQKQGIGGDAAKLRRIRSNFDFSNYIFQIRLSNVSLKIGQKGHFRLFHCQICS